MYDLGSINDKRREKGYPVILDSQLVDILRYVPESEYEDTLLNHVAPARALSPEMVDAIAAAAASAVLADDADWPDAAYEPSVEELVEDSKIVAIPRPRKKKAKAAE